MKEQDVGRKRINIISDELKEKGKDLKKGTLDESKKTTNCMLERYV